MTGVQGVPNGLRADAKCEGKQGTDSNSKSHHDSYLGATGLVSTLSLLRF